MAPEGMQPKRPRPLVEACEGRETVPRTMLHRSEALELSADGIDGRIHLWLDFYPPNRQRRDDDNLMAAFKAGRDGLADALGLDDARFVCHPWLKDEPVKGGKVHARITGGPDE